MKIRYTNTRLDIIQGHLWLTTYNRGLHLVEALILAVLGWVLWTGGDPAEPVASKMVRIALSLFFVVCVTLAARVVLATINVFFAKNKGLVGEHTLEIKDEGIEERTDHNTSLHKWSSPVKIRPAGSCRLLFVTENSAHIIPPQSRVTEGNREQFLSALITRI